MRVRNKSKVGLMLIPIFHITINFIDRDKWKVAFQLALRSRTGLVLHLIVGRKRTSSENTTIPRDITVIRRFHQSYMSRFSGKITIGNEFNFVHFHNHSTPTCKIVYHLKSSVKQHTHFNILITSD